MKIVKGKDLKLSVETMAHLLEEDHLLQEIVGLSDEKMLLIYDYASELYEDKKYQDASDILYLLIILNPINFYFWQAFGIASLKIDDLPAASAAFETAIALDPSQPDPYLYLQEVLIKQREMDAAKQINTFLKNNNFNYSSNELDVIIKKSDSLLGINK